MPKPVQFDDEEMERLPFITGSHAYGSPGPKSDVDLVVLLSRQIKNILNLYNENHETIAIRFGKLNIIPILTEQEYDAWKEATEQMAEVKRKTGATFTKEVASDKIRAAHKRRGLSYPEFGVSS